MTEKEIKTAILKILNEVKADVRGYCLFAAREAHERHELIKQSCYEFLASYIEESMTLTVEEATDEMPF